MSDHQKKDTASRRTFLKRAGTVADASAISAMATPTVHAAEDNTIRVALVGCGGRGTGAAANALSVKNGPIRLVAMADVFENRLKASHTSISQKFGELCDVPEDRRFLGFDGYRQAMDCLRPGDVVILTTPPAFRWPHFSYAIEKGLNVFMEKPVTVDGPSTKKILELAKQSDEKNLKVGVGLMWRHCQARQELCSRIRDGEIGELLTLRTYRLHSPIGHFLAPPKPDNISHLMYQTREFHAFLWASGGCYSDFYIHNIDELCWIKDAWPVKAHALGGRHYRGDSLDQNFDNYSVEYTYADGTKMFMFGRCIVGCHNEFGDYLHGTKGLGTISSNTTGRGTCRIYNGQDPIDSQIRWKAPPEPSPYQLEWDNLVDAIRQDKPYNEVPRGAMASLITSMGRMAAHTGKIITYEQMAECDHEFAPGVDKFTADSPAPLQPDADGIYPVPKPGIITKREY